MLALNPSGTNKWDFKTGDDVSECPSVYSQIIIGNGLLYTTTTSAKIFCITPSRHGKWRYAAERPWLAGRGGSKNFTSPPLGKKGFLHCVLAEGKVYTFSDGEGK